jgi:crossover junction endodeoxyribonuclease RuvC
MGFGLIRVINKKWVLQLNELQLSKYDNHYQKLKLERTIELIDTHNPDEVAIEAPFFGKKCAVDVEVGTCAGVAMAALSRDIRLLNTNLRKLKWLLLMEMPLKNKWLRCCSNFRQGIT